MKNKKYNGKICDKIRMTKLTEKHGGKIWKIETYNGKIVYKIKNLKNMVAK